MKLKLEEWMQIRRVNQSQIAEAIGISRQSVNAWLKPKIKDGKEVRVFPDFNSFEKLCIFLDATPNDLLELEPEKVHLEKTWEDFTGPSRKA